MEFGFCEHFDLDVVLDSSRHGSCGLLQPSLALKLGIRPVHSGVVNLFLQSRDVQSVTWVSHLTQAGGFLQ